MKAKVHFTFQLFLPLLGFSFAIGLAGCASIPAEAPALSQELGNRITAIEESHLTLLHTFFNQKRAIVDQFINDEWIPHFADEFFSHPTITEAWDTIVLEDDTAARMEFLLRVGPRLQRKINAKRRELIAPLDNLEAAMALKLQGEYTQARAINNSLTSFLISAADISANQSRFLDRLGMSDAQVGTVINQIDAAVGELHSGAEEVGDKVALAKEYRSKLQEILSGL